MIKIRSFILFILAAFILFALAACSGGQDEPTNNPTVPNNPATSNPPQSSTGNESPQPSPEPLPNYTFDEIVASAPTRFSERGDKIEVWVSGDRNYYGEITIGRSYVSGASGNIDGTYALFVTNDGTLPLKATLRDEGYYGAYADKGSVQGNAVEFPFNASANAGSLSTCKKDHEVTFNISGLNYIRVFWSRSNGISADATLKMMAVVITPDDAVRYVQDGTLPSALQGLTVTGLDKIFREPLFSGDTASTGGAVSVVTSDGHSLAIMADSSLWAWGWNSNGQLGDGTNASKTSPVKIMDDVVSVSVGALSSFAITSDGVLWAWGSSQNGRLGIGANTANLTPVNVMDDVASITQSGSNSFAIKNDGSLWAWGGGGLFGASEKDKTSPEHIMDDVASVWPNGNYCYVVKTDGSLWMYGLNQIPGDGEYKQTFSLPILPIHIMDDVVSVSSGSHCFAVKSDGSLWAWGRNDYYQLGDGTQETRLSSVKIMDDVVYAATMYGFNFSYAIKADGSLWAWGDNDDGRLGNGQSGRGIYGTVPEKVMDNAASLIITNEYTFVVKMDGSLWAWGNNSEGQFGDGTKERKTLPVHIMDDVEAISAYQYRVNIIKTDGSLWAWGSGTEAEKVMD